jgi:hypothetical protein
LSSILNNSILRWGVTYTLLGRSERASDWD